MKKLLVFLLVIFTSLVSPSFALAANSDLMAEKIVEVKKDEVLNHDFFGAGENVIISGTVNGDVFAAGSNVTIDGVVNGDVLSAGAIVTISGKVSGNIRAAGNIITLQGPVAKNISIFGNIITLDSTSQVIGSALFGGNVVTVNGNIGKDVRGYGNQVTLNDQIAGDVQGSMRRLSLGPNAKIFGSLNYQSPEKTDIGIGQVAGKVTYKPVEEKNHPNVSRVSLLPLAGFFVGLKFIFEIFSFLVSLVLGLIYFSLFPKRAEGILQMIQTQPWLSLGLGFLTLFLFPIFVFILVLTLIGIPLLFILIPISLFFIYMSKIFVAFYLGRRIAKNESLLGPLALGLLIYYILRFIPVVSALTSIVFVTVGLGAFILDIKSLRSKTN